MEETRHRVEEAALITTVADVAICDLLRRVTEIARFASQTGPRPAVTSIKILRVENSFVQKLRQGCVRWHRSQLTDERCEPSRAKRLLQILEDDPTRFSIELN